MTPICSEHSALLKRIAKNLNDHTARGVYADWLQERGEPAWYVVASYEPDYWFVRGHRRKAYEEASTPIQRGRFVTTEIVRLPWLEGSVEVRGVHESTRTKQALSQFAEGKAK